MILAESPDIVFIQEAPLPDKAVYLRKLLKDYNYRQHRLMAIATKKRGQEFTFVEPVKSKYPPIVSIYVYFNDTRVPLVNMHMPAFPQHDLSLVDETSADFGTTGLWLREYLAEDVPTIVAGDMNMVQQARFHRELRGLLTDSFAATGLGFGHTIPSVFPMRRTITASGTCSQCPTSSAIPLSPVRTARSHIAPDLPDQTPGVAPSTQAP